MKVLRNQKGMTLVEMIVAFALLAMFMVSAVAALTVSMRIFQRSISISRAQTVGAILLEDITGHIGKASAELEYSDSSIAFKNAKGDREILYIGTEEKELCIHYDEDVDTKRKAVEWRYPKNTYMKNQVTAMKIKKMETIDNRMLFKITIDLKNERTGYKYQASRMVECYYSESELNAKETKAQCTCDNRVEIP